MSGAMTRGRRKKGRFHPLAALGPAALVLVLAAAAPGATARAASGAGVSLGISCGAGPAAADELARTPARGEPVRIEIWVDRGEGATYREGNRVGVRFRTNRDCFVVIYDIDTEGFLTLLYPDDPYDDGFVRGGRVYRLPGSRAGYDLVAEGPPGVEYVAAVAALAPLGGRLPWYLAEGYETYGYRGYEDLEASVDEVGAVRGDPFVAMSDIAYDILPAGLLQRQYDTDYTYFHVGRRYAHPRYVCYDCHGRVCWMDPYRDACSVFEVRVSLDWTFVSHPTLCLVSPRFWYWRRPGCPSAYLEFPAFWCSLYPRRLYRVYFWDGLVSAASRWRSSGPAYPPPRYRGKPQVWVRSGGPPGSRAFGRGSGGSGYSRPEAGRSGRSKSSFRIVTKDGGRRVRSGDSPREGARRVSKRGGPGREMHGGKTKAGKAARAGAGAEPRARKPAREMKSAGSRDGKAARSEAGSKLRARKPAREMKSARSKAGKAVRSKPAGRSKPAKDRARKRR